MVLTPRLFALEQKLSVAECSTSVVTSVLLPFALSVADHKAVFIDSVAEPVKMTSLLMQFMNSAIIRLEASMSDFSFAPNEYVLLGFPHSDDKCLSISSHTSWATGVVALWSR